MYFSAAPQEEIMPQNLLEQLRKYTVVVADTGDIEAMEKFRPQDATTNPSLITAAAQMPQYQPIVDGVLKDARNELGEGATDKAWPTWPSSAWPSPSAKRFWPSFPAASPPKSTRASPTTPRPPSPRRAPSLRSTTQAGIGRNRILIKIASTWEGIRAAEVLEKEGIHCNLTLLFGCTRPLPAPRPASR
jgi:transaldolase